MDNTFVVVVVVLELDELLPPGILTATALFTPSLSFPTATTAFAEISATINAHTATPRNNAHLLIEPPAILLIFQSPIQHFNINTPQTSV